MQLDTFQTIQSQSEAVFSDKGSKFLAYAFPIQHIEDYKNCLTITKALHPKARHHCWALRYSQDRSIFKLSDDGEPSGSAGRPILNCLLSADVTNICVVIVRYFGGTLLGVPGLINAYKTSTQAAIDNAQIITQIVEETYEIYFKYPQINEVMRIIKSAQLQIIHQHFDNECRIELNIRKSNIAELASRFKSIPSLTFTSLPSL